MGEDGLKRIKLPDLEEKSVVDRLYQMYQGSNKGKPVPGKSNVICQSSAVLHLQCSISLTGEYRHLLIQRYEIGQEDVFRQPSSNVVKLKIMSYLSKSKVATESFPSALQVSFDCLYGRSAGVWEEETAVVHKGSLVECKRV